MIRHFRLVLITFHLQVEEDERNREKRYRPRQCSPSANEIREEHEK